MVSIYKLRSRVEDDEWYSKTELMNATGVIARRMDGFLDGVPFVSNQNKNMFLYKGSDVNKRIDDLVKDKRAIVFSDQFCYDWN